MCVVVLGLLGDILGSVPALGTCSGKLLVEVYRVKFFLESGS